MTAPRLVEIGGPQAAGDVQDLMRLLEELLPVRFVSGTEAADASIVFDDGVPPARAVGHVLRQRSVTSCPHSLRAQGTVHFADDPEVPFPFRGRSVMTSWRQQGPALQPAPGDKVLAHCADGVLWTVSQTFTSRQHCSCLAVPVLPPGQGFVAAFNGDGFLEMLVWLQFLREVAAPDAFLAAPLRAAFIVDDPNLHWPTYGCVNYADLARYGEREHCHFAFATIPLDSWFTHPSTASTFRRHPRALSLLIHGNDHAKAELVQAYPPERRASLLRQAVRRIEQLELRSGLQVCRVMVPPHGACSSDMLRAMPAHGFESACISSGSLRAHNPTQAWVRTLGHKPSEVVEGCPVLPRWGLTGNVRNTLMVAAFLGQPLILRGHHQDFRDGLERFGEFARFINGLGEVRWSKLSSLSRMNLEARQDGDVCWLRPLGHLVEHELPPGVRNLIVGAHHPTGSDARWEVQWSDGSRHRAAGGEVLQVPATHQGTLRIRREIAVAPAPSVAHRTAARLVLRRLMTEARDRLRVPV